MSHNFHFFFSVYQQQEKQKSQNLEPETLKTPRYLCLMGIPSVTDWDTDCINFYIHLVSKDIKISDVTLFFCTDKVVSSTPTASQPLHGQSTGH